MAVRNYSREVILNKNWPMEYTPLTAQK